jgi:hypothetical protein
LIKLAIAALIIMGTSPKINAPFHVMQTGLFPGGELPQPVFPKHDPGAFALQ